MAQIVDPILVKKGKEERSVFRVDLPAWLEDGWKVVDLTKEDEALTTTASVAGEEGGPNPTVTRRAKTVEADKSPASGADAEGKR